MPSSSWSSQPSRAQYFSRQPSHPLTPPGASIPSPPIDHVRKITPPEEHKIHTDERLAIAEDHSSPYEQAERYVEGYRAWIKPGPSQHLPRRLEDYETPLRIKMSMRDWNKLNQKLDQSESDDPYPRLSYNAATSTLIVQCMPTPLHQSITSLLNNEFMQSRANLPRNLRNQTSVAWETTNNKFGDNWFGSKKRPDMSLEVQNAARQFELKWVVEAGLSETYDQLVEDAQLWLEGHRTVAMVILVKFGEVPRYHCPVSSDQNPEELGISLKGEEIEEAEVTMLGQLGPATYKGLQWVGKISEVFMETWVQDGEGRAVQQGNREDLLQVGAVQLSFGNILPPGYPQMITLPLDDFHVLLERKMRELAAFRCREMVAAWLKRLGDGQSDRDYQPSE